MYILLGKTIVKFYIGYIKVKVFAFEYMSQYSIIHYSIKIGR